MKKITCLLFALLLIMNVNAQKPDWSWCVGPTSNLASFDPAGVATAPNGNVYVAGNISGSGSIKFGNNTLNTSGGTIVIAAFDATNTLLWARQYDSAGNGYIRGIAVDTGGNICITGDFYSPVFRLGSINLNIGLIGSGVQDVFIAKLDNTGNPLWAKSGSVQGRGSSTGICTDRNGNIAYTGNYAVSMTLGTVVLNEVPGTAGYSLFTANYDGSGTLLWAKTAGGHTNAESAGISVDGAGNFFVTGNFWRDLTFGTVAINTANIYNSVFVAKYSPTGTVLWAKYAGGGSADDFAYAVAADTSGNVFVAGSYKSTTINFGATALSNSGIANIFLAKYNSQGVPQWAHKAGGARIETATALATDLSGDVYMAGNITSDITVIDSITLPLIGTGSSGNFFVAKYNAGGAVQWAKRDYKPTNYISGSTIGLTSAGLAVNRCNDIYVTGSGGAGNQVAFDLTGPLNNTSGYIARMAGLIGGNIIATCNGGTDGSAYINVLPPAVAPYTYQWSNGYTADSIINVSTGTYVVKVTDAVGCIRTGEVIVNSKSDINSSFVVNGVKCSGPCTGVATATPVNGIAPYTYMWDASAGSQNTVSATGLCPATYSVTITDKLGCFKTFPVRISTIAAGSTILPIVNFGAVDRVTLDPSINIDVPTTIVANSSNPDNFADIGSTLRLKMKCQNKKTAGVSLANTKCILRSNNPYVTITDSIASFGNIAYDSAAWSDDEVEINISSATLRGTSLTLDMVFINNGIEYPNTCLVVPVSPLVLAWQNDTTITDNNTDNSHGNGNSICEDGETIVYKPLVNNIGPARANFARSVLQNRDTLSYINIWNNHSGVSGNVSDTTTWSGSIGIINGGTNVPPKSPFVFDYANIRTVKDFHLYHLFSSTFRLVPGHSVVQCPFRWTVPFTFNNSRLLVPGNDISSEVIIYPNPGQGHFTFSLPTEGTYTLTVIDLSGRIIQRDTYIGNQISLDIDAPSGTYLVRITDERSKESMMKKIVVVR